jgi:hypothetical protein
MEYTIIKLKEIDSFNQKVTELIIDECGILITAGHTEYANQLYQGMIVNRFQLLEEGNLVKLSPSSTSQLKEECLIPYPVETITVFHTKNEKNKCLNCKKTDVHLMPVVRYKWLKNGCVRMSQHYKHIVCPPKPA